MTYCFHLCLVCSVLFKWLGFLVLCLVFLSPATELCFFDNLLFVCYFLLPIKGVKTHILESAFGSTLAFLTISCPILSLVIAEITGDKKRGRGGMSYSICCEMMCLVSLRVYLIKFDIQICFV